MFPAFAHFRRTATRTPSSAAARSSKGDKVALWYPSSNRDEERYEDPDRFDVTRNPEHQAFGAGGRHFCLGTALARLELKILVEETVRRFPQMAARRRADVGRLAVLEPAQDAAGAAVRLTGGRHCAPRRSRLLLSRESSSHVRSSLASPR